MLKAALTTASEILETGLVTPSLVLDDFTHKDINLQAVPQAAVASVHLVK